MTFFNLTFITVEALRARQHTITDHSFPLRRETLATIPTGVCCDAGVDERGTQARV